MTHHTGAHGPLYFLGLPWQHTRGSALLGWVKDDAEYLARQISAMPPTQAPLSEHAAPSLSSSK
jgi:putative flavoprotein involved in K+ transport